MSRAWRKNSSLSEAFGHAGRGVGEAVMLKSKLWIAFGCGAAALLLGLVMKLSPVALAMIVLTSVVVIAAEMFNTALEALEDIIAPEYREAVRRSKDLAAGAVLVLACGAAAVALLLFLPSVSAFLLYY